MTPEETPAPEGTQEAPESGPEEAPAPESQEDSQPAVDYEKRYTDLRSQYDRIHPRLNEYEQFFGNLKNPETQAEALRALGLELDGEETEDYPPDPDERIERMEQYLQQQEETQQLTQVQQLEETYLDQELTSLEESQNNGEKFSKEEEQTIVNLADRMRDHEGVPDVAGAFELLSKAATARNERYMQSKKASRVEVGAAGTDAVDLSDDDARQQYMAEIIEAQMQADS